MSAVVAGTVARVIALLVSGLFVVDCAEHLAVGGRIDFSCVDG